MSARNKDVPSAKSKPNSGGSGGVGGPSVASTMASATATTSASMSSSSLATSTKTSRVKASMTSTVVATTAATTSGGASGADTTTTTVATTTVVTKSSTPPHSATPSPPTSLTGDGEPRSQSRKPPVVTKAPSPLSENAPPSTQVDTSQCALCGADNSGVAADIMVCRCCGCGFHAQCANLPQTPEEGEFFCRLECFTTFRKNQGVPPKTPLSDFSRLAAGVESILGGMPRRPAPLPQHGGPVSRDIELQNRARERASKRALQATTSRSRSSSPYEPHDGRVPQGPAPPNGYAREGRHSGDRVPRHGHPSHPRSFNSHIDLTQDDDDEPLAPPRSPRSRPPRNVARPPVDESPFEDPDQVRGKRAKYLPHDDPMTGTDPRSHASSRHEGYGPPSRRGAHSPGQNGTDAFASEVPYRRGSGGAPGPATMYDPRSGPHGPGPVRGPPVPAPASGSSRLPSEHGSRGGSARSSHSRPGSGNSRYEDRVGDEFDAALATRGGQPPGPPRSRPAPADQFVEHDGARRGYPPAAGPSRGKHGYASMPPAKYNIPWLNPAAFPQGLRERFECKPDNANGVFRIDLSPVFADKTTHLYQSEIDFFFRCFESADVSLVVKGMASELNQYIWAWPFILESCGYDTHFTFDHFQFRQKPGGLPELEYVGELRLSMAAYNAYLERCFSGNRAKEVLVLEDHVTKKPITLVAAENIIALNDLVIAEHCAQLYNDLIKSFQWDVFAGGIHCLLQYLPQASRHKRFSSPLLHFNFPGARGRLRDPGNGTTDQAYQVLVGSLELVIFERLEPKDRDTFHSVLYSAGYDPKAKPMLLDAHLRVLRDAGFAWSTVLLNDGEFVHVNKGRLHFWRVVEPAVVRGPIVNSPCVFLSWEWVYQGVSQRGISTECWFAMKNASLCTSGWAFDPRRAIVEAAKCGVAIVRTGQFLTSLATPNVPAGLLQLAFAGPVSSSAIDRQVVAQRQEQMVLFLESILPCMDAIVEEEFELGLVKDDSDDFRKIFDDEIMWKTVHTALNARHPLRVSVQDRDYGCGICGLELTNIYKQCLGCTVHAHRARPNVEYPVFRICLRCHAQPEHHLFKPRALHRFNDKLCSSEGHTGLLPATRRYQSERSYFKCRCTPYVRCTYCGGCESCCCLCHTLFQTRFRYTAPEHLDHLRTDVVEVIKGHKLQQQERLALASHGAAALEER